VAKQPRRDQKGALWRFKRSRTSARTQAAITTAQPTGRSADYLTKNMQVVENAGFSA
jgi:predicted RNA-binding protein YlxR (DUF448 family)